MFSFNIVIKYLLFIILFIILFLFVFHYIYNVDILSSKKYNLEKDGLIVIKNAFSTKEIEDWKDNCIKNNYKEVKEKIVNHSKLNKKIKRELGDEYIFQDYILFIKKAAVHTCHRDYNGDFFNNKQQYKSYTMIIYLEDMEKCLGVIPTSHKDLSSFQINITDPVKHIICSKGDIILFDANLIHVGSLNKKRDNLRIQLKISHRGDLEALEYYQNYNKVLNEDNQLPWFLRHTQQKLSCFAPSISDLTQKENINAVKKEKNGFLQKLFSYFFYGNKDFYELKNVF
jgi:ectoine hydroxylase-related dioxygenase (phytanoyl-CoA dioxygenase family)